MMRRRPPDGNRNLARAAASGTNATDDSHPSFSSPRESGSPARQTRYWRPGARIRVAFAGVTEQVGLKC